MDYGGAGLDQTLKILKNHSIAYFGAGLNEKEASMPYRYDFKIGKKDFHLVIIGGLNYSRKYDSACSFYAGKDSAGVNEWKRKKLIKQINSIRSAVKPAFIIAYLHWFENYVWKTEDQTKQAHAMIDAGANIVMGQSTHKRRA